MKESFFKKNETSCKKFHCIIILFSNLVTVSKTEISKRTVVINRKQKV